jgi:hypothetical protein
MVASPSTSPTSDDSGVPTFPASATGRPASRQMAPSSSVVVVLPFVPVTATNRFGRSRQASSSSPSTGTPRSRAAAITDASFGTPGLFTTQATPPSSSTPSVPRWASTSSGTSGVPESTATTSPCALSMRTAAVPDRASPTTRYGPSGSGGLTPGSRPGRA